MKFLKTLAKSLSPAAAQVGTIVVSSTAGQVQAGALVRQLLLVGGAAAATNGYLRQEDVEPIAGALVVLGTLVIGQLHTRKERIEKIELAERAPNGVNATGQ